MRYIDFDGVILDTEELLFKECRKNPDRHLLPIEEKIKYMQSADWHKILLESPVINDSLYILKQMDTNTSQILTTVHSLTNEGYEKIKYLRDHNIAQNVILVPYLLKKSDMVNPYDNILVDDSLKNLDDWSLNGGCSLFFDKNNNNIDNFGVLNCQKHQRVRRINEKYRY